MMKTPPSATATIFIAITSSATAKTAARGGGFRIEAASPSFSRVCQMRRSLTDVHAQTFFHGHDSPFSVAFTPPPLADAAAAFCFHFFSAVQPRFNLRLHFPLQNLRYSREQRLEVLLRTD